MARAWCEWKMSEIRRLVKVYPTLSKEELVAEFAPHSWNAIRITANGYGAVRRRAQPRKKWLEICAAHKPTFAWAQPAEGAGETNPRH